MAKPDQVLIIEPQSELRFRGPFSAPVTSYMKLSNPTDKKVMFKIKTTAPKKYCVRPNSGALEGNARVEIAICLQPFIFDPNEKNKHKFMVQTVFAPDGEMSAEQVWKDIPPERIMDSKLKCVFEVPPAEDEGNCQELIKASPKLTVQQTATSPNMEDDLKRARDEVVSLREEESTLRQENLRLKEDMLRLKQMAGIGCGKEAVTSKYSPPVQSHGFSVLYVVIGIVLAAVGVIVGKFAL